MSEFDGSAPVYGKTSAGRREVEMRKHDLDRAERMLLIMINGSTPTDRLAHRMKALGDISAAIERLVNEGFIEDVANVAASERARKTDEPAMSATQAAIAGDPVASGFSLTSAKQSLETLLEDYFGPMSGPLVIKLNDCAEQQDLQRYILECRALISAAINEDRAAEFMRDAQQVVPLQAEQ